MKYRLKMMSPIYLQCFSFVDTACPRLQLAFEGSNETVPNIPFWLKNLLSISHYRMARNFRMFMAWMIEAVENVAQSVAVT